MLDEGVHVDRVCGVLVLAAGVIAVVCGSVAECAEESGDAMSAVLG